jgi:pro-apoptotic serine protease NMA111
MLSRASVPRHAIIKKFAGEVIEKIDDFISVLSKLSRGARVPLEYVNYSDRHRNKVILSILKFFKVHCICKPHNISICKQQ